MFSLQINSSQIPNKGISLPLVLRSPLFLTDSGKIPGSYFFTSRFPRTVELEREFGHAQRIAKHGRATAELPYLIQFGILRYQGTCIVTQADQDGYEIAFKVDSGDFAGKLAGKTLKDLDLGGDRDIATVCSSACIFEPILINQNDPNYFEIAVTAPNQIITDFSSSFSNSGRTFTSNVTIAAKQIIRVACEFFYGQLRVISKKNGVEILNEVISSNSGDAVFTSNLNLVPGDVYTVETSAESEVSNEGQSIVLNIYQYTVEYISLNHFTESVSKDQDTSDFVVFPILNNKLLENFPEDAFELDNLSLKILYRDYFPVQNYWRNGEFPILLKGEKEGEHFLVANLFTPFVYCYKLLKELVSDAGYRLLNHPFAYTDGNYDGWAGAVIFNAYSENTYTSSDTRLVPVKTTFNLTDHVPEMKQSDFINWICQLTGYRPVINNNELTIDFVRVKSAHIESADNAALSFPGTLLKDQKIKVAPEYKGIKLELKKASTDQYQSDRIKEISSKLVYKGEVENFNDLPATGNVVNDMYKVTHMNTFCVWQYSSETYQLAWSDFSRDWPLVYQEGEEPFLTITTEFSPVLTAEVLDEVVGAPDERRWRLPITWQPGILEGFPDSLSAEYGIQMLLYKGLSRDSLNQQYPLGSSRKEDYYTSADFTNLNARDVFENEYKAWLRWLVYAAKPVTVKAILSPKDLKFIQDNIHHIWRGSNFSFLIEELRVNIQHDSLSGVEMDIYTC